MEGNKTFGKMMEDWLVINGINRTEARRRFGFGFDKWILDQCVPKADRIPELSDKTGYTVNEIEEGMRRTRELIIQMRQGKEQVRKFNMKYHPELIKKDEKPAEHTQAEINEEAEAVRKLKEGLTRIDIVSKTALSDDEVRSELKVIKNDNFDILLESYAKTFSEKEALERKMDEIRNRIIEIDNQLITIKNSIRRAV